MGYKSTRGRYSRETGATHNAWGSRERVRRQQGPLIVRRPMQRGAHSAVQMLHRCGWPLHAQHACPLIQQCRPKHGCSARSPRPVPRRALRRHAQVGGHSELATLMPESLIHSTMNKPTKMQQMSPYTESPRK